MFGFENLDLGSLLRACTAWHGETVLDMGTENKGIAQRSRINTNKASIDYTVNEMKRNNLQVHMLRNFMHQFGIPLLYVSCCLGT